MSLLDRLQKCIDFIRQRLEPLDTGLAPDNHVRTTVTVHEGEIVLAEEPVRQYVSILLRPPQPFQEMRREVV